MVKHWCWSRNISNSSTVLVYSGKEIYYGGHTSCLYLFPTLFFNIFSFETINGSINGLKSMEAQKMMDRKFPRNVDVLHKIWATVTIIRWSRQDA